MREWLKNIRRERGESQYDTADVIGIPQSTYAMIESGTRRPSVDMAKKIGAALGFDWTWFYEEATRRATNEEFKGGKKMVYERITDLCEKRGISIARLEREVGLGNATIRGWATSSPNVDNLKKVADYFGEPVDSLLRKEDGA